MSNKNYKYDGTDTFPKKIRTSDGYILTKVNDGIYENNFLPQYRYKRGEVTLIPDVEKYEVIIEKNEYRFYIYDWILGQQLITIDTDKKKSKIDGFNIYGQCYSLGDKWKKITSAMIKRTTQRIGYLYDDFIEKHFVNPNYHLYKKLLFKSNDYNECIKFLADYGAENLNNSIYKGEEYDKIYKEYYKSYLDIPENKIGEILKDGTVRKEYFQEGHIYKNICNFYRQDGICYIAEGQADKIDKNSKLGEDYETYQTIYEKVKEAYEKAGINEKKYKLKDFVATIFNDLNWQSVEALTMDSIEALDDEYFLDYEEELEKE
ncbi:hypothetical protein [uncultured Clostridium sp.]|uniref:hypothetical protein n=1 Tax=uncultured Clostridium sp. TaxID=59620 RepID=UPI0027295EFD|nr:hypothetical protein [uncultured Clostridium sp.]